MKLVINKCYGGFGLSNKAVMRYAELSGFKLYPFVETRDEDGNLDIYHFKPYKEGERAFCIHYHKKPLNKDGTYKKHGYFSPSDISRDDKVLIQVIEELGVKANAEHSSLSIIELPDNISWTIEEYDGLEWVSEQHRTWR